MEYSEPRLRNICIFGCMFAVGVVHVYVTGACAPPNAYCLWCSLFVASALRAQRGSRSDAQRQGGQKMGSAESGDLEGWSGDLGVETEESG